MILALGKAQTWLQSSHNLPPSPHAEEVRARPAPSDRAHWRITHHRIYLDRLGSGRKEERHTSGMSYNMMNIEHQGMAHTHLIMSSGVSFPSLPSSWRSLQYSRQTGRFSRVPIVYTVEGSLFRQKMIVLPLSFATCRSHTGWNLLESHVETRFDDTSEGEIEPPSTAHSSFAWVERQQQQKPHPHSHGDFVGHPLLLERWTPPRVHWGGFSPHACKPHMLPVHLPPCPIFVLEFVAMEVSSGVESCFGRVVWFKPLQKHQERVSMTDCRSWCKV